jgi:hypothetical protein
MDISGFRRVAEAREREKQRLAVYAPVKPAKPAPAPIEPKADPAKTAAAIIHAGRVRRGESPPEEPASPLARAILRAGAKARGERVEDDDDTKPDDAEDDDDDTPEIVDADTDDDAAKKAKDLARKIIEAGKRRRNE